MRRKFQEGKKLLKEFESMKGMAKLRALSKHSLENPLNDSEYKRMMELKSKFFPRKLITEKVK